MKLDDLRPGMVVACGNRQRIGDAGLWKAVVVQAGGWSRSRSFSRGFKSNEWGSDVAIAVLDPDTKEWTPDVVLPRIIVMPWAEYLERDAAIRSAKALRKERERERRQNLIERTRAVHKRLRELGIASQGGFNPPMESSTLIEIDLEDVEQLLAKLDGGTP